MSTAPEPARDLVPAGENLPSSLRNQLPGIVARAGNAAVFAAEEFFFGRIRNEHTRRAYFIAGTLLSGDGRARTTPPTNRAHYPKTSITPTHTYVIYRATVNIETDFRRSECRKLKVGSAAGH